jgi:phosphoglycolate phosphatase
MENFVFDLDGTLVQTDLDFPAMKAAVLALARDWGAGTEDLQRMDILGAIAHVCVRLEDRGAGFRSAAFERLGEWELAAAARCREIPGSTRLLSTLKERGRRIGIVTRNSRKASTIALSRVPLPYDVLLTRDDVERAKPEPEHL